MFRRRQKGRDGEGNAEKTDRLQKDQLVADVPRWRLDAAQQVTPKSREIGGTTPDTLLPCHKVNRCTRPLFQLAQGAISIST